MKVVNATADNFDELISRHEFVVIDFWAPWCAPCKGFSQVCAELSEDYKDITFLAINIEDQKTLAKEFEVRSVPWVMIMRKRVLLYADSGALSKSSLVELIEQAKAVDESTLQSSSEK
ncbi:MAG: thiol reductase thioredoxin [Gammaproteobacteria bacterium RIFCSPHIGHO2_12_FULL_41_15]|nr:MAG: thiol reductase thioredoxin [Gammaproteobacteria bacterium RIFCSPHIGHO2_12_FULL_41_15]